MSSMQHPTLTIGKTYFVENPAGKSFLGRLVAIVDPFTVALTECVWVADTGRYHVFMRGGYDDNCELEPCQNQPAVRYQNISEWPFPIPRDPK